MITPTSKRTTYGTKSVAQKNRNTSIQHTIISALTIPIVERRPSVQISGGHPD
jgi:hypothetical protein